MRFYRKMEHYLEQLHPHVCINLVLHWNMILCPLGPCAMSSIQSLPCSHLHSCKPYKNNSSSTPSHTLSNSNSCWHVLLKYPAPSHVPTSRTLRRYYTWTLLASSHTHPTRLSSTNHGAIWV